MNRAEAMLKARELTEGSLRESELILDEVDYVGYRAIPKARALITREGAVSYDVHYYMTDKSVDVATRTGLEPAWVANARPNQDPNSSLFIP